MYGNDLSGNSGQIASPLYPRTYPNNANYHWTITVDGDAYIQIRFLDMDIEDAYDCYYDHLKVRACVFKVTVYPKQFQLWSEMMFYTVNPNNN